MERQAVSSSNLVSVGYDPEARVLEIEFKKSIYHYSGVPRQIYEGLMSAGSKGTYHAANIKKLFPYTKGEFIPERDEAAAEATVPPEISTSAPEGGEQ
jgi:hypothetical protein